MTNVYALQASQEPLKPLALALDGLAAAVGLQDPPPVLLGDLDDAKNPWAGWGGFCYHQPLTKEGGGEVILNADTCKGTPSPWRLARGLRAIYLHEVAHRHCHAAGHGNPGHGAVFFAVYAALLERTAAFEGMTGGWMRLGLYDVQDAVQWEAIAHGVAFGKAHAADAATVPARDLPALAAASLQAGRAETARAEAVRARVEAESEKAARHEAATWQRAAKAEERMRHKAEAEAERAGAEAGRLARALARRDFALGAVCLLSVLALALR